MILVLLIRRQIVDPVGRLAEHEGPAQVRLVAADAAAAVDDDLRLALRDIDDLRQDAGRAAAESLVRTHRLWEAYLVENFQLPLDHLHVPAEKIEHFIGPELQQQLAGAIEAYDYRHAVILVDAIIKELMP